MKESDDARELAPLDTDCAGGLWGHLRARALDPANDGWVEYPDLRGRGAGLTDGEPDLRWLGLLITLGAAVATGWLLNDVARWVLSR